MIGYAAARHAPPSGRQAQPSAELSVQTATPAHECAEHADVHGRRDRPRAAACLARSAADAQRRAAFRVDPDAPPLVSRGARPAPD